MKTIQKLKIFSLLMAMPFVTNAALDCPSGRLFSVSGFTATHSILPHLLVQSGTMHLELRKNALDPEPKYTFDCGLIGRIVEQSNETGVTKLDHTMICNSKDSFNTSEDVATVTGGALPILFITEVISNIEHGEGLFKNMRADMTATGTINLSPPFNNDFTLAGEVCLKKKN
ncbi:MAG: hypothetical protein ACXWTS_04695 [Methylococcaceae bacterium]